MDSIGSVSRNTAFSTDPAAGAQLTVAIIGCVFPDNSFTYPTNALNDFTKALNRAAGGAYFVRGGGSAFGARHDNTWHDRWRGWKSVGYRPIDRQYFSQLDQYALRERNFSESRECCFMATTPGALRQDPVLYEWATVPSEPCVQAGRSGLGL